MKMGDALLLLRIPFSFFLLPVFLFAASLMDHPNLDRIVDLFIILHLFIYPASNAYNSYMDQDEGSIGGLKNPPKAGPLVFWLSIAFNLLGLSYAYFAFGPLETLAIGTYILASILYSWKAIRLKRYAIPGFLTVFVFQGAFIYALVFLSCQTVSYQEAIIQKNFFIPALISSGLIAGIYPMTQIYQHKEDAKNGDNTLSRLLGIKGTFEFCGIAFTLASSALGYHYINTNQSHLFYIFILFNTPSIIYFTWWAFKVWENPKKADFRHTMMLNKTSSIAMVLYFIVVYYIRNTHELPF